jgi:hypothetical protein
MAEGQRGWGAYEVGGNMKIFLTFFRNMDKNLALSI